MGEGNNGRIMREFGRRRTRQIYGMVITVLLMFVFLWKQKHPGLFFDALSEQSASWMIILLIFVFILFSFVNWRCPACDRYLGHSLYQLACRKCGVRLR